MAAGGMSAVLAVVVFALSAGLLTFAGQVFGSSYPGPLQDGRTRLEAPTGRSHLISNPLGPSLRTAFDVITEGLPLAHRPGDTPGHPTPVPQPPEIPEPGAPPAPDVPTPTIPFVGAAVDVEAGPIGGSVSVAVGHSSGEPTETTVHGPGMDVTVSVGDDPVSDTVTTVTGTLDCPLTC
jgi:hypothetical protein